jgi:hypothetical protein
VTVKSGGRTDACRVADAPMRRAPPRGSILSRAREDCNNSGRRPLRTPVRETLLSRDRNQLVRPPIQGYVISDQRKQDAVESQGQS